jgi:hypothetical protein
MQSKGRANRPTGFTTRRKGFVKGTAGR